MSEASRCIALGEAVKTVGSAGAAEVLKVAELYNAFTQKDVVKAPATSTTPGAEPEKLTTAGTKQTTAKATAAKANSVKAPAKTEEEVVEAAIQKDATEAEAAAEAEVDAEEQRTAVSTAITGMISAGLRKEAVELLGKYGAKSLSSVKPVHYAAIIRKAEELWLAA